MRLDVYLYVHVRLLRVWCVILCGRTCVNLACKNTSIYIQVDKVLETAVDTIGFHPGTREGYQAA